MLQRFKVGEEYELQYAYKGVGFLKIVKRTFHTVVVQWPNGEQRRKKVQRVTDAQGRRSEHVTFDNRGVHRTWLDAALSRAALRAAEEKAAFERAAALAELWRAVERADAYMAAWAAVKASRAQIMRRAHEIAKNLSACWPYRRRLSLGLRVAHREAALNCCAPRVDHSYMQLKARELRRTHELTWNDAQRIAWAKDILFSLDVWKATPAAGWDQDCLPYFNPDNVSVDAPLMRYRVAGAERAAAPVSDLAPLPLFVDRQTYDASDQRFGRRRGEVRRRAETRSLAIAAE